jgi:type II secretory pathway component GspD/PulD (secretin)
MKSLVKNSAGLAFLLAISLQAQPTATEDPQRIAEEEAVRRANQTILLHRKLDEAQAALRRNQLATAANLYLEAVNHIPLAEVGKPSVEADKRAALAGLDSTEMALARQAMASGDMISANARVAVALKEDPNNEEVRKLKAEIDLRTKEQAGRVPSPEMLKRIPEVEKQKVEIAERVQNAKLLYEMGKLSESEAILVQVLRDDPSNGMAPYYLDLIKEARFKERARMREATVKSALVNVETAWIPATNDLPTPNAWANTNLVYTSKGRQGILSKLDRMRLNEVRYNAVPLTEVLNQLRRESTNRDPDGIGINFMVNPYKETSGLGGIAPTDITGGVAAGAGSVGGRQAVDMSQITITISPPMSDLRFADVLDAITKVAEQPIRYTVEDYAVVFSPKPDDQVSLYTKVFKVDPNTFIQGLQSVFAISLNPGMSTGSTGGTGGGGGGGAQGGGGGAAGGTSSTGATIPGVNFAPGAAAGATGAGGAAGAIGGAGAGGAGGAGGLGPVGGAGGGQVAGGAAALFTGGALNFVTRPLDTITLHQLVRAYFTAAGVILTDPGKSVFFNDRTGLLFVRATEQDLEIIQEAIETLNQTPPQLSIEAKFAELSQEDSKGLGFNWYLGNTLLNKGAVGVQGGTAPSFQGPSSTANPSGIFPGPGTLTPGSTTYTPGPGAVASSSSDNVLTSGLRQTVGTSGSLPTVATLTGIMTDPQFRVAINAIEQRTGNDLLSAPKVITLSGRQAHIAAQDLQYIVTSTTVTETSTSGGGLAGGSGAVAPSIGYSASPFSFGPVLDVLPTVSADGYSIQMTLIPTYTEFVGYDPPGQFVPQAQAATGSTIGVPLTAQLPLPHFRVREVVTTCNVWDGQTVVLGGLIGETITKIKDKVPMLGDLPLVGKLFQSQSSDATKENLLIFVTPTIIDPSGNRVHTDEDLPFAKTTIPVQPPTAVP